jgi:hypothetical protein
MLRLVLAPLALLMLIVVPATADAPRDALARTRPNHMAPPLGMPFEKVVPPPLVLPDEHPAGIMVRRIKGDVSNLGKIDKDLSQACQAGLFRELKASKMIAVSSNATLGVAFGHGLGLVEPKKLADRSKVYYFYHASTPLCMVRAEDNWDPAYARSR